MMAGKETVVTVTSATAGNVAASLDAADIRYDPTGHVQWREELVVVSDFLLLWFETGPRGHARPQRGQHQVGGASLTD